MPSDAPTIDGCVIDDVTTTPSRRAARPARHDHRHQRHRRRHVRRRRQVTSSSSYRDDDLLLVSSPTCHALGIPPGFGGNEVQSPVSYHHGNVTTTRTPIAPGDDARMYASKRSQSTVSSDLKLPSSSGSSVPIRSFALNEPPKDTTFVTRSSWVVESYRHQNLSSVTSPCCRQATADDNSDELLTSSTTMTKTAVIATAFVRRRNERERERVRCVNEAYEALRHRIPEEFEAIRIGASGLSATRASKVETLRSAIRYIRFLNDLLSGYTFSG